jgi:uncharacterized membrane protein YfcA
VLSAYPPAVWALLLGTSGQIGLPAGLWGVGGGIAAVPVLLDVFFAGAAVSVGGGTLGTPMLSLFSCPIKRAIGVGALFNLVISVPATLFFLTADLGTPDRTVDALGDVALFCVAALSLPALFVAPVAARWSVRAPVSVLRRLFALCLAAIALRLLLRT